jgi:ribonuclease BN (tRNA processing enzyme)
VELIVLGSDGTWPRAGGAASGYLLRHEDSALWVDAGTGTLSNLQRHVGVFDVDALVLSHAHQDHFLDLFPFFYARWLSSDGHPARPLPVFAPPGLVERAADLMTEDARERLGLVFEPRPVEPGETFEAGAFTVRTAPMRHYLPTLGIRVEAGGSAFAYSADTAPTGELVSLAAGADVLVAEATLTARGDPGVLHLSAAEAGEHATAAGVGRLVLSHLRDERNRAGERAAGGFGGRIDVAEEGMVVTP